MDCARDRPNVTDTLNRNAVHRRSELDTVRFRDHGHPFVRYGQYICGDCEEDKQKTSSCHRHSNHGGASLPLGGTCRWYIYQLGQLI